MVFYVYLLECRDKSLYCGYAKDLKKRTELHCRGKASKYTRVRRPVKLVFFETAKTKSNAMKREFEIKSFSRKKKLSLIKTSKNTCLQKNKKDQTLNNT